MRLWGGIGALLLAGSLTILLASGPLQADGGTQRVSNAPMGAYRVNVFTDPTPVPPDTIDVSVLVTFERGRGVATGLDIVVVARSLGGDGVVLSRAATREQAEDPRYYAAKFSLGAVGEWEIEVRLTGPEGAGVVAFRIAVQEPGLLGNPLLILLTALLPILLIGWWLRKSTGPVSSPSTRPGD